LTYTILTDRVIKLSVFKIEILVFVVTYSVTDSNFVTCGWVIRIEVAAKWVGSRNPKFLVWVPGAMTSLIGRSSGLIGKDCCNYTSCNSSVVSRRVLPGSEFK